MKSFIEDFKSFINTKTWTGGAGTGEEIEIIGPSLGKSTRKNSLQQAASFLGKDIGKAIATVTVEAETITNRLTGTVIKYNDPKGYGFVEVRSTGERLFFHINESIDPGLGWLSYGERISFEIGKDAKGRSQAEKIKLIGGRK